MIDKRPPRRQPVDAIGHHHLRPRARRLRVSRRHGRLARRSQRSGWLDAPLAIARGIDAVSAAIGVKGVGVALRKRFAAMIGDDESLQTGRERVHLISQQGRRKPFAPRQ